MEAVLSCGPMVALLLSLALQATTASGWDRPSAFRANSVLTLALGALFLALEAALAREAPGEWGFRLFYATLCLASLAASNWFVLAEMRRAS